MHTPTGMHVVHHVCDRKTTYVCMFFVMMLIIPPRGAHKGATLAVKPTGHTDV